MCCEQRREAKKQTRTASVLQRPVAPSAELTRAPIVFTGKETYLVTGPHSREVYSFSGTGAEQWVEAIDAQALLLTGFFAPGTSHPGA